MRHAPALAGLVLVVAAACFRQEQSTTTTITQRVPVPGLADSVAGPAPARVAARLLPDSDSTASHVPVDTAVARGFCAPALRDPASGERFLARRTQVTTHTTRPDRETTVHELRGWGDYWPLAPEANGMTAGQALRVDCATNEVRGIAPAPAPTPGA